MLAFQSGNHDLRAQGRLGKRNRYGAIQIFAFALKEGMRLHPQDNIKIACRTAIQAGIALLVMPDAHAILYARRDRDLNFVLVHDPRFTPAFAAGIGDNTSGAPACRAGAGNAEKTLAIQDLATTGAGGAVARLLASGAARPFALFASLVTPDSDFSLLTESCFFERQGDVGAHVAALLCAIAAS